MQITDQMKNLTLNRTNNFTSIDAQIEPAFSSYLSDPRRQYTLKLSMVDCTTSENILDSERCAATSCFWCRHRFAALPIGCPIRYLPTQVVRTIVSKNDDCYTIKENVHGSQTECVRKAYFETDGIFCSFNCCLAFINDNAHKSRYRHSKTLLANMYAAAVGHVAQIQAAPSWRLLAEYGGHMSIDEFRQTFNKVKYTESFEVKNVPRRVSVAVAYEKRKHL
jgi:hypothetical protein